MMLMCELVDEEDPILQASSKEIVELREKKVRSQDRGSETHVDTTDAWGDSESYVDVTGISANFAGADAAIAMCARPWRSSLYASRPQDKVVYVVPEVHESQYVGAVEIDMCATKTDTEEEGQRSRRRNRARRRKQCQCSVWCFA